MTLVYAYCFLALTLAGFFALLRVERGTSMLDRVVSLDIITAVVIGGIAVVSAQTGRTDLVPVLVVLTIVGFVGSVAVARFSAVESKEEARILTREELEAALAMDRQLSDEDAPVHDPDAAEELDGDEVADDTDKTQADATEDDAGRAGHGEGNPR